MPTRRSSSSSLALAIVLAIALGGAACDRKPEVSIEVGSDTRWSFDEPCKPGKATIAIATDRGASVELLGQTKEMGVDGRVEFTVRGEDVPEGQTLVATVRHDDQTVEHTIDLGNRWGRVEVAGAKGPSDSIVPLDLSVTGVLKPLGFRGGFNPQGDGVVILHACNVESIAIEQAEVTRNDAEHFTLTFPDLLDEAARQLAADSFETTLPLTLRGKNGRDSELKLTLRVNRVMFLNTLPGSPDKPLTWAPAHESATRPYAVITRGLGRDIATFIPEGKTLLQASLLADVQTRHEGAGQCGPYKLTGSSQMVSAARQKTHADVTVVETRTGREIARKSFRGSRPACPSSILAKGYTGGVISGPIDESAIRAWLRKVAR